MRPDWCPSYSQVITEVTQCVVSGWPLAVRWGGGNWALPGVAGRTLLHRFQRLDLGLLHQAVELASFHADSVLAVSCFLSGDVPEGHPAELYYLRWIQERPERDKT